MISEKNRVLGVFWRREYYWFPLSAIILASQIAKYLKPREHQIRYQELLVLLPGVRTAFVGILGIDSQYSKGNPEGVASCVILGVVGITSVVFGVMNLRSEGITKTLGEQYRVRIYPELTRGDRGEIGYRLGMTFSY